MNNTPLTVARRIHSTLSMSPVTFHISGRTFASNRIAANPGIVFSSGIIRVSSSGSYEQSQSIVQTTSECAAFIPVKTAAVMPWLTACRMQRQRARAPPDDRALRPERRGRRPRRRDEQHPGSLWHARTLDLLAGVPVERVRRVPRPRHPGSTEHALGYFRGGCERCWDGRRVVELRFRAALSVDRGRGLHLASRVSRSALSCTRGEFAGNSGRLELGWVRRSSRGRLASRRWDRSPGFSPLPSAVPQRLGYRSRGLNRGRPVSRDALEPRASGWRTGQPLANWQLRARRAHH